MREPGFVSMNFGVSVLLATFPQLAEVAPSETVLAPLFDVLCWQLRLRFLDAHSIYRIAKPVYDAEENKYKIYRSGSPFVSVFISFRWMMNVNRNGFGGLTLAEREQLPDRGMFPPRRISMVKEIVIEGDRPFVELVSDRFHGFLREEAGRGDLLSLLRRFARERLMDQPHAWLALDSAVAEFYSITTPT